MQKKNVCKIIFVLARIQMMTLLMVILLLYFFIKCFTEQGLKADAWINSVTKLVQGRGGGNATFARSQGKGRHRVRECLGAAEEYARTAIHKE